VTEFSRVMDEFKRRRDLLCLHYVGDAQGFYAAEGRLRAELGLELSEINVEAMQVEENAKCLQQ